jgi:hypothetical protein
MSKLMALMTAIAAAAALRGYDVGDQNDARAAFL